MSTQTENEEEAVPLKLAIMFGSNKFPRSQERGVDIREEVEEALSLGNVDYLTIDFFENTGKNKVMAMIEIRADSISNLSLVDISNHMQMQDSYRQIIISSSNPLLDVFGEGHFKRLPIGR